jgi:uncharacterized protein (DUF1015 family)
VLPTHRVLTTPLRAVADIKRVLRDGFDLEEFPFQNGAEPEHRRRFLRTLQSRGQTEQVFGLAIRDVPAYYVLALRPAPGVPVGQSAQERLDVSVLHTHVLPRLKPDSAAEPAITYTKDEHEALDLVRRGEAQAALLLNATKVAEVRAVATAGGRMPHKSTYFFPKQLTGMVLNLFDAF